MEQKRLRTWVERCDPEYHGFWAGDPEDLGYLTENERDELSLDPGITCISVDWDELIKNE